MEDKPSFVKNAQGHEIIATNQPLLQEKHFQSSTFLDMPHDQQTQISDLPDTMPNASESDIFSGDNDCSEGSPTQVTEILKCLEFRMTSGIIQSPGDVVLFARSKPIENNDCVEEHYEGSQTHLLPEILESLNSEGTGSPGHYSTVQTQIISTQGNDLAMVDSPPNTQHIDGSIFDSGEHVSTTFGTLQPSIGTYFTSSKPYRSRSVIQCELSNTAKAKTTRLGASNSPNNDAASESVVKTALEDESIDPSQETNDSIQLCLPGTLSGMGRDARNLVMESSTSSNQLDVNNREQSDEDLHVNSKPVVFFVIPESQIVDREMNFCEDSQSSQDVSNDSSSSPHRPLGSFPSLKDLRSKTAGPPSVATESGEVGINSVKIDSAASFSSAGKPPLNKLSCRERKRITTSFNRPPALTRTMTQWITKTHNMLDPFREDEDCWFHPAPPPARPAANGTLRPCGKLQKRFTWQDHRGKHSLVLNYGIVSKIINYKLNKQQKDGFINKQWHLSHLCGNWTCLNPEHTTVEPGKVNISRNNCFSHRSGCSHDPPCLKDKKVLLSMDGIPVYLESLGNSAPSKKEKGTWDDWSIQSFDDGEVSVMIDENDEIEFALDEDEDEDEHEDEEDVILVNAKGVEQR